MSKRLFLASPIILILGFFWTLMPANTNAQFYINQNEMADILDRCPVDLEKLPDVNYEYFELYSSRNNNVLARNTFYKIIGEGNLSLGKKRSKLVSMLNRSLMEFARVGDTLVIPSRFDLNFCAYSPYPHFYDGAKAFNKLFIIDKTSQSFAAYEKGKLVRWGIVNTGAKASPTPNGRFNFNWKTEFRISTLSPPGEDWEMYWVFNFHQARGIHIHQYAMPTGGPTSHGCVRMIEEDAKFIYNWADSWKTTLGNGPGSERGRILKQGTTVLVIGEDPPKKPHPFMETLRYPILKKIDLPGNPYDVPPGTSQQKQFDQKRIRGTR